MPIDRQDNGRGLGNDAMYDEDPASQGGAQKLVECIYLMLINPFALPGIPSAARDDPLARNPEPRSRRGAGRGASVQRRPHWQRADASLAVPA